MARVLEIGCGEDPVGQRRFSAEADRYISELSPGRLAIAAGHDPVPAACASAVELPFPDQTFDYVLAKDVFGDPALGYTIEDLFGFSYSSEEEFTAKFKEYQAGILKKSLSETILDSMTQLDYEHDSAISKNGIILDVARVLRRSGCLVVIETRTPHVAAEFLMGISRNQSRGKYKQRVITGPDSAPLMKVNRLAGTSQQRRFCSPEELGDPALAVWQLQKP